MVPPTVRVFAAALALATVALPGSAPASSTGAEVASFARVTTSLKAKGYTVVFEVDDIDGARVIDTTPPTVRPPSDAPLEAAVCVTALKETNRARVRTSVFEAACPGPTEAYRFNPVTMQAGLTDTIATSRWTRVWRVRGNRWTLVTDKRQASEARIAATWQGTGTPSTDPTFCGFGPGVARRVSATITGSVSFPGLRLTIPLDGAHGALGWSTCAPLELA